MMALLTMVLIGGCATLKDQWSNLTPGEKARIVLGDMQDQLTTAFDTAKDYVDSHPEYRDTWRNQVIPAFDTANKAIAAAVVLAKEDKITVSDVVMKMQPLMDSILNLLNAMGVTLPGSAFLQFERYMEPMQASVDYALLIPLILAGINGLMGIALNLYTSLQQIAGKEAIPTWEEITDKNKILQDKIDAEK
jgi:hypothetical protein